MLLCAHTRYFHPLTVFKAGWRRNMPAYSTIYTHICVCLCVCASNRPKQSLSVQNNDIQLPRMSMSLPVFVRSYLLLPWKPDAILKYSLSLSAASCLSLDKNQSMRESQTLSPTLAAAARLSAMIHGKDRVCANAMLVDQVSQAAVRCPLHAEITM